MNTGCYTLILKRMRSSIPKLLRTLMMKILAKSTVLAEDNEKVKTEDVEDLRGVEDVEDPGHVNSTWSIPQCSSSTSPPAPSGHSWCKDYWRLLSSPQSSFFFQDWTPLGRSWRCQWGASWQELLRRSRTRRQTKYWAWLEDSPEKEDDTEEQIKLDEITLELLL